MKMNWETFQTAYQSAQPELRDLIDSTKISDSVDLLIERKSLSVDKRELVNIFSSYVLKIIGTAEVENALEKIGIDDATIFIKEFNDNIGLQTGSNLESKNDLESEIAQVEQEMETLHSLRTMSADMQAVKESETVHTSNQDELLKKPEPQTIPEVVIPSPSDAPRWGSEN